MPANSSQWSTMTASTSERFVSRVEILRFADVPDEFALAEAEGDVNAADFRASHLSYWTGVGEIIGDDTKVVTVYFDLLPEIVRPE